MWKIRVNPTQPDPTRNPIDPNPISTRLKWPVFDPWPVWPVTQLTQPEPDPTRPVRFAMSNHYVEPISYLNNFAVYLD